MVRLQHVDEDLLAYVRHAIAIRRAHPVLRRRQYQVDPGHSVWSAPDGQVLCPAMWQDPARHRVAVFVAGSVGPDHDPWWEPLLGRNLLVLAKGEADPEEFRIRDLTIRSAAGPVAPGTAHLVPGPGHDPTSVTLVRAGQTVLAPRPWPAHALVGGGPGAMTACT